MTEAMVAKMIGEAMREAGGQTMSVEMIVALAGFGTFFLIYAGKAIVQMIIQILNAKNGNPMKSADDRSVTRRECDKCHNNLTMLMAEAKEQRSLLFNKVEAVEKAVGDLPDRIAVRLAANGGG
jgi:S-ribosylhomocysteine lyase LuxS involved in autoinducer biosynthesis